MNLTYSIFNGLIRFEPLLFKGLFGLKPLKVAVLMGAVLIFAPISWADTKPAAGSKSSVPWKWRLEIDSKYTCIATKYNSRNTDTHTGSVSFEMPDVAGKVQGKGNKYTYTVTGQTSGNPYQFSSPGKLTFKGKVTPGTLRFTPQVYLPDGTPFFQPVKTYEMPIYDGAKYSGKPGSHAEVTCDGYVTYTLRGPPREHYRILVDDRLLYYHFDGSFHNEKGGLIKYATSITIQVITEMEVVIEDEKVKMVSGTRRLGRLTPASEPPSVWRVSAFKGKCRDGMQYPYVPALSNSQVSAIIQSKSSLKLSVPKESVRVAMKRKIDPKQAKLVSPGIQHGQPERYNRTLCQTLSLESTAWTFPRRRSSIKTTEDTSNHLQVLYVTQEATAMSPAKGTSSGLPPGTTYFKGDKNP